MGISVSRQAQPVPQDAFGRNESHVPSGDKDSLMQNSAVGLALRYLLAGWSRHIDLESERA